MMILRRLFLFLSGIFFLSAFSSCPVEAASKRAAPAPLTYRSAFAALEDGGTEKALAMMARGRDEALNLVLKSLVMAHPNNPYSFEEMAAFVSEHPDWPGLKGIMMILEQKIPETAAPDQVARWFDAHPPLTPSGFSRFIEALLVTGQAPQAAKAVKARWRERAFAKGDEAVFLARYASFLDEKDHEARLDRLLWDEEIEAARALYPYVDEGHKALAEARIALANQTRAAQTLLAQVPASLRRDAGLLYERLRKARKDEDERGALDILFDAPEDLGRPEEWWREANILLRRFIERKDFKTAYRIAATHRLKTGFDFVQAEFLAGWLALRFLERTDLAHTHFSALTKDAATPISRARGAYWLARTYESAGQKEDARQAYETAAALNTTYYGQLAIARLYDRPMISAASEPAIPQAVRVRFFDRSVVRATEALYKIGETERARTFFKAITSFASQRVDFALALELAYQLQRPDWAVSAAKAANQKNILITGAAYPVLALDIPNPPELALTHALIRQESEFRADAGSPVGARGLMQLMPGTAKDVAKKLGLRYAPSRLTDPDFNVRLGTTFIQGQIDAFDGSYILALAGYNAGPRRAREWIDAFGDPRDPRVDPVDWVELIPIYETRNYVQRIIENLQFYRARLKNGQAPLRILEDLKR